MDRRMDDEPYCFGGAVVSALCDEALCSVGLVVVDEEYDQIVWPDRTVVML